MVDDFDSGGARNRGGIGIKKLAKRITAHIVNYHCVTLVPSPSSLYRNKVGIGWKAAQNRRFLVNPLHQYTVAMQSLVQLLERDEFARALQGVFFVRISASQQDLCSASYTERAHDEVLMFDERWQMMGVDTHGLSDG